MNAPEQLIRGNRKRRKDRRRGGRRVGNIRIVFLVELTLSFNSIRSNFIRVNNHFIGTCIHII